MKLKDLTACLWVLLGLFASCIQEEALNTEADIESVTLPGDVMNRSAVFGDAIMEKRWYQSVSYHSVCKGRNGYYTFGSRADSD